MHNLVPFVVLTVPFVFVIIITWLKNNEKSKRYQLQADLYGKALEKGQPVPTDWFKNAEQKKKRNPLNIGIVCIAVGVAMSVFFWLMAIGLGRFEKEAYEALTSVSSVGIIPFLIGVAYVIIHFIEKKKAETEDAK
jgi:uncharacterized membrane protein